MDRTDPGPKDKPIITSVTMVPKEMQMPKEIVITRSARGHVLLSAHRCTSCGLVNTCSLLVPSIYEQRFASFVHRS